MPAASKSVFRLWRPRLPRLPRPGRRNGPGGAGHDDLQRPALARGMALPRPAGAELVWWATTRPPTTRTAASSEAPGCAPSTPARRAIQRLHECDLGLAVAKAGDEDGAGLIGGSCIVDPNGVMVAEAPGSATR